uniref:Protein E7 n=1 Tax=Mops bat papillomavirus TaxID=3141892 RepID=A0AAU7E3Q7_9PAPI
MIGKQATLQEIVLQEPPPEPVSLNCHETLDEEEPNTLPYKIAVQCYFCLRVPRIVVHCTPGGIRALQDLLLRDLHVVCTKCALDRRYYG